MKIQDIIDAWAIDAVMDSLALDVESLKAPQLHAKYYQFLMTENAILKRQQRNLGALKRKKWEFYLGKGTAEEYREANFKTTVIKADVQIYLDADEELLELIEKIGQQEMKVQLLKDIITSINNRNWVIRNAIEWQRFINGLN